MKTQVGIVAIVVTLLWVGAVVGMDIFFTHQLVEQWQTDRFAEASGRVLSSEVIVTHGKSTHYHPQIRYAYSVSGRNFSGDRYRFTGPLNSSSSVADKIVADYPPGKPITVHYDPADQSRAVLKTGIEGGDLATMLIGVPFNCIAISMLTAGARGIRQKISPRPAGGATLIDDGLQFRARLNPISPLNAALTALGAGSLVGMLGLAIFLSHGPSVRDVELVAAGTVAIALLVGLWMKLRILAGRWDLSIDRTHQFLSPPPSCKNAPARVPFNSIARIVVIKVEHRGSRGGTTYTYSPAIVLGTDQVVALPSFNNSWQASDFATWLLAQTCKDAAVQSTVEVVSRDELMREERVTA